MRLHTEKKQKKTGSTERLHAKLVDQLQPSPVQSMAGSATPKLVITVKTEISIFYMEKTDKKSWKSQIGSNILASVFFHLVSMFKLSENCSYVINFDSKKHSL